MDTKPKLIPELKVQGFETSINFYTDLAMFTVLYSRPEDEFAMLDKEGAQLMIESLDTTSRTWMTGKLEPPFGRGINFQIEVSNIDELYDNFKIQNYTIYLDIEEKWYRKDSTEVGNRQFLVQDPDGYLLRFFQDLGERSAE